MTNLTKDDPRFNVVLDMDDPDFGEKLIAAIGAKPGEEIEFIAPPHKRTDGRVITYIPKTADEFNALKSLSKTARKTLGMGAWGEVPEGQPDAKMLWLFPGEWFSSVPAGLEVVDIMGETETWNPDEADDDIRFGCLAYGFLYEPEIRENGRKT